MVCASSVNYLQPTGFRMLIDRRRFANVSFYIQSVDHPGLTTSAAESPFRKYESLPQLPDSYTYGQLTVNIILDENMNSYTELLNWMLANVDGNPIAAGEEEPSHSDIVLSILTSKNNINKTVYYRDAFPTDLGSFTMAANTDGTEVIVFSVTFRYTKFDIE